GVALGRFGIQVVASPRHADGIVVTGPVSENMRSALLATYAAVPAPKLVIAVGACAISGGPYVDNPEVHNGCGSLLPVDLYVPGCPPHPMTILDGLLRLLGRLPGPAPLTDDSRSAGKDSLLQYFAEKLDQRLGRRIGGQAEVHVDLVVRRLPGAEDRDGNARGFQHVTEMLRLRGRVG